jgi:outer membrane receptor protein involved in Fe transport
MRVLPTAVACLLATTALSSIATAQPAPPAETGKVEKVVVTAQRRPQQAQSIGIALTPIKGQELRDRGINVVNGLENITPSLEVENQFGSGQVSFTIRGLGFRDYATNNTPTVGIYVDEVAYPLPVMTQGVLFDVQRVEVLRGPQGTLYGRNTTGGAINILSNKPSPELEGGFQVEYGRFDEARAEGFFNAPIANGVNVRLSAATDQGGAWQVNRETGEELGDADKIAARTQVDIAFSDHFSVLLNLHGYRDESDGVGKQLFVNFLGNPLAAPAPRHTGRLTSWGTDPLFAAVVGIAPGGKPFLDNEGFGFSATANADLSFGTLTYIGAFEHLDRREYNDFDALTEGYAGVFFLSDADVQTHELRLRSNDEGPLQWVVGAYYSAEDLAEVYNSGFAASFGPGFETVRTPYDQEVQTMSVFGQAEYKLTPDLNAVLGLRWEQEDRDLFNLGTFIVPFGDLNLGTCTVPFTPATCTTDLLSRSLSTDEVTGKVALEYQVSDDALFYAGVSRGIKSGGFTAYNTLNPSAVDPFVPEKLWAYELGFKSDLADDTLRLNGAVFYYDYRDQQVQSAIATPVASPPPFDLTLVGKIVNAAKSEVYGGELEVVWKAAPELTITQALGYKHGEFKDFIDISFTYPFPPLDRSGQDIGFPELSYSGALTYERQTNLGFTYTAHFDYSFRDEQSFPLLGPAFTLDSYWLANAYVAFKPDGWNWQFALWGRNIFDEQYEETRNTFVTGTTDDFSVPGRPATYGVRVSAAF